MSLTYSKYAISMSLTYSKYAISMLLTYSSPETLGFQMEKNNIKLKILGCVQNVLLYYL